MTTTSPPKAFVSHASEDKDRFVVDFARRLRENGVDAWLDQWEMLPGDSLIDRIFEEAIKDASAFIIVLSKISVSKPWVREELNAAAVRRITNKCRLIPVLIDDCDVPECLKSTLWERIHNTSQYDTELSRIVNSVFGLTEKPEIGPAPIHSSTDPIFRYPDLNKIDNVVLTEICECSIRERDPYVTGIDCLQKLCDNSISEEEIIESLEMLQDTHHISISRCFGGKGLQNLAGIKIYEHTFDQFARAKWNNYSDVLLEISSGIVNLRWREDSNFEEIDAHPRLLGHHIRMLERQSLISVSRHVGGFWITSVSPRLSRNLDNL
jgi:hypothetical protein